MRGRLLAALGMQQQAEGEEAGQQVDGQQQQQQQQQQAPPLPEAVVDCMLRLGADDLDLVLNHPLATHAQVGLEGGGVGGAQRMCTGVVAGVRACTYVAGVAHLLHPHWGGHTVRRAQCYSLPLLVSGRWTLVLLPLALESLLLNAGGVRALCLHLLCLFQNHACSAIRGSSGHCWRLLLSSFFFVAAQRNARAHGHGTSLHTHALAIVLRPCNHCTTSTIGAVGTMIVLQCCVNAGCGAAGRAAAGWPACLGGVPA